MRTQHYTATSACGQGLHYSDPDESEQSSVASRARKAYGLSPMRLAGRPAGLLRLVSTAGPTEGGGCQEPHVPRSMLRRLQAEPGAERLFAV